MTGTDNDDTVGVDLDGDGTIDAIDAIDAIESIEVTGIDIDGDGTTDEVAVTEVTSTPDDL
jgi:hypothetical protein